MKHWIRFAAVGLALVGACDGDFAPVSAVSNVRILATQASLPYARPGDMVTLATLAVDGRATKAAPLRITYFPTPCVNPEDDDVKRCYPALADEFPTDTDLTPMLSEGDTFSLTMPADTVSGHGEARGGPPYGLAYVFVAACAGHIERVETSSRGTPPFGCFDGARQRLGADDFVFAFARVTASDVLKNSNPTIDAVTADGSPLDPSVGLTVARCSKSSVEDCPTLKLDVAVPSASQEPDPVASSPDSPSGEEVWLDTYVSAGKVANDRIILYDGLTGKTPDTSNKFFTPQTAGDFGVWMVVRANRGGVSWQAFPLHVR